MKSINIIYFDEKLGWVEDTMDLPAMEESLINQGTDMAEPIKFNSSTESTR